MTENGKQLLIKDLCARLPYGLQIHITSDECDDFSKEQYPHSEHDWMLEFKN